MSVNRIQWTIIFIALAIHLAATRNAFLYGQPKRILDEREARAVVDGFNEMRSNVTPTAGNMGRLVSQRIPLPFVQNLTPA